VNLEEQGKPAAAIVTGSFEDLAYRMADHNKHPNLQVLVLPYPLEERPEAEVRQIAREYYPKLLGMLGATDG
jgi:hypothetical protein